MNKQEHLIIHILGASGSGKTTLGNKIKADLGSKIHVVDTDDIDDYNVLDMLTSKKYDNLLTDQKIEDFFKIKDKRNSDLMLNIINKTKKPLVIVGHTLTNTDADPMTYAKYKYFIDSDPSQNYKQYMMRTYNDICSNCDNIQSLIKHKLNPYELDLLLIHKYKIRPSPPYMGFIQNINRIKSDAHHAGYDILQTNEIYKSIETIIIKL